MRTVAVIRALALGDMICAIPTFRALRDRFPSAHIALIGLPWAAALVERFPAYLDELIEFGGYPGIPEVPVDPARTLSFLGAMQERDFDLVVQLQGDGTVINEFASLLGGRRLAGFVPAGGRPPRLDDRDTRIPYPARGSEVDRLLALAGALGATGERRLEFPVTDDDRQAADATLQAAGGSRTRDQPLAIIHPGGSRPERRWPADRFAEVGDALAADGYLVAVTGTAGEALATAGVCEAMRAPALDLAGRTTLGSMAGLVDGARIVVTNDTGISHLAAAIGTDSVTVFSASDRERWVPVGSARNVAVGQGVPEGTEGPRVDVPVTDVLGAARRLLA